MSKDNGQKKSEPIDTPINLHSGDEKETNQSHIWNVWSRDTISGSQTQTAILLFDSPMYSKTTLLN